MLASKHSLTPKTDTKKYKSLFFGTECTLAPAEILGLVLDPHLNTSGAAHLTFAQLYCVHVRIASFSLPRF